VVLQPCRYTYVADFLSACSSGITLVVHCLLCSNVYTQCCRFATYVEPSLQIFSVEEPYHKIRTLQQSYVHILVRHGRRLLPPYYRYSICNLFSNAQLALLLRAFLRGCSSICRPAHFTQSLGKVDETERHTETEKEYRKENRISTTVSEKVFCGN
jgi:hypothetical protein